MWVEYAHNTLWHSALSMVLLNASLVTLLSPLPSRRMSLGFYQLKKQGLTEFHRMLIGASHWHSKGRGYSNVMSAKNQSSNFLRGHLPERNTFPVFLQSCLITPAKSLLFRFRPRVGCLHGLYFQQIVQQAAR